jgi:hypothetical protein
LSDLFASISRLRLTVAFARCELLSRDYLPVLASLLALQGRRRAHLFKISKLHG